MKKRTLIITAIVVGLGLGTWFFVHRIHNNPAGMVQAEEEGEKDEEIERLLSTRRAEESTSSKADPFGKDGIAKVLLIGLDKRIGQAEGHCDAIQLITIEKEKQSVTITAVPRGTYSPLPPGKGVTSSDYYVSNACGLGGLEYGVTQIEKILGQKADYIVVVGFSETLGILRTLHLPTTETLQWLRNRQGYRIGEPQRARNHSTFLKELLVKFIPQEESKADTLLEYIVYKVVQTDLSFAEARSLVNTLTDFDLSNHPERIHLAMRPAYAVQDILYDPDHIDEHLDQTLGPVRQHLSGISYTGEDKETVQNKLWQSIEEKKNDPAFIKWAFENNLWLQVEDESKRNELQYGITSAYIVSLTPEKREEILTDYILEMEYRGLKEWKDKGEQLLTTTKVISKSGS